jgi:hypothetical protein
MVVLVMDAAGSLHARRRIPDLERGFLGHIPSNDETILPLATL